MPTHHTAHHHRTQAFFRTLDILRHHGLNPDRHAQDVESILMHPAVGRLFELLEAAGRGVDVTAEGDERLRLSLCLVLGLIEHAADAASRTGGVETEALRRGREGLLMALGG